MQELYGRFESFWIIHAREIFSREVTGLCLRPRIPSGTRLIFGWEWGGVGNSIYPWPEVRLVHMD